MVVDVTCDNIKVNGINSGVSSVAYPNLNIINTTYTYMSGGKRRRRRRKSTYM